MTSRIPCRAVFLDAGGVIVLPHRDLVARALSRVGIRLDDPGAVARAHYRAVREFDRAGASNPVYARAFPSQLGIIPGRTAEALDALAELADRRRSGEIMWSEPTPRAFQTIAALRRRGLAVVVVTNSDGHAEENLRDCCGIDVPVIDSVVVGSEKPDGGIFRAALHRAGEVLSALGRAGVRPSDVVHVGDTLSADVAGARAAGITPIHFDPLRACRARDHRHVRTLPGIWQHVAPADRL
jgi:putative hydrolase of the HAD superfamily